MFCRDVPYSVCSTGGEGEVSPGVFVAEADDRVGDIGHQDVYIEIHFMP